MIKHLLQARCPIRQVEESAMQQVKGPVDSLATADSLFQPRGRGCDQPMAGLVALLSCCKQPCTNVL